MSTNPNSLITQLGQLFGFGGGVDSNGNPIQSTPAQGLLNLLGVGGQVGQAALTNARVSDAINYIKGVGGLASGEFPTANTNGTNTYANQTNSLDAILNGSNPYMSTISSGISGINSLTPQIYGNTVGAQNLVASDPTSEAALQQLLGVTGTLGGIGGAAQNLIGTGGQTALNSQIAGTAGNLAGINPLMSMGQAAGFAVDQSGRANAQAAEQARQQAINQGGAAGTTVANGAGNSDLADFASQGSANIANSLQNAMSGQQGLQLSQVLGGLNAQQGAAALQQALTGMGFTNALGATGQTSGIDTNALSQLLAGQEGAANIGSNYIQLNQGQNAALNTAGNTGAQNTLAGTGQLGSQANNWLQYASQLLGTDANTAASYARLMEHPNYGWAQLLGNLGGMTKPAGGASGGGGSAPPAGTQGPIGQQPGGFQYPQIGALGGPYPGATAPTLNNPNPLSVFDPSLLPTVQGADTSGLSASTILNYILGDYSGPSFGDGQQPIASGGPVDTNPLLAFAGQGDTMPPGFGGGGGGYGGSGVDLSGIGATGNFYDTLNNFYNSGGLGGYGDAGYPEA